MSATKCECGHVECLGPASPAGHWFNMYGNSLSDLARERAARALLEGEVGRLQHQRAQAVGLIEDELRPEIAALRTALGGFLVPPDPSEAFERIAAEFTRETGKLPPGKDSAPAAGGSDRASEDQWLIWKVRRFQRLQDAARAALTRPPETTRHDP